MVELTKLNDVYENWATGDGVFTDLNNFDVPWKEENNIAGLNMAYHGAHSGDKNISPVVYKFLKSEDVNTRSKLANIIFTMFADKWAKLWGALEVEYNPLSNYDMVEDESINGSNGETVTRTGTDTTTMTGTDTNASSGSDTLTMTGTDTNAKSGNDTLTMTGTDTNAKTGNDTVKQTGTDNVAHTGDNENLVSAFNSASYEDSSKTEFNSSDNNTKNLENKTTYASTDTETRNMSDQTTYASSNTETRNMTDQTTYGKSETETRNMTDTVTHNTTDTTAGTNATARHLTRSGNIGVTTSQQMLQSEIELRKWLFYQSVFNDIDTILTLSIY